jgi:hypothetical protein
MNRKETSAFVKDLQKLLKKHNMMVMTSSNPETLAESTKGLEGYNFFITKGEKKLCLRGGESIMFESSQVIKLNKRKNNEDGD